jgi:hypothetical protein
MKLVYRSGRTLASFMRGRNATCAGKQERKSVVTRRILLVSSFGLAALSHAGLAAAKRKFWEIKEPSEWSDEETGQLLSRSPWAKETIVELNMRDMDQTPGGGGPEMGGAPPRITATVRWESARAIADAEKRPPLKDAVKYYIVSLTSLNVPGPRNDGEDDGSDRRANMDEEIKKQTYLQFKGRDRISPERIDTRQSSGAITFLFPRGESPTQEKKEVLFVTRMGPAAINAKFLVKDMLYKGGPDL